MDDAHQFGHEHVAKFLEKAMKQVCKYFDYFYRKTKCRMTNLLKGDTCLKVKKIKQSKKRFCDKYLPELFKVFEKGTRLWL